MKYRLLGNTGIAVSEVAFGCVELGIPYGIGVNSERDMLSDGQAIDLLNSAVDSGINFFDTARMYGKSEQILGEAFKDRRKDVVIATKCVHLLDADGKLPAPDVLKEKIEASLFKSLEALRTDYVDVFMLHQASEEIINSQEILTIFSKLKEQGLFRASGISTYSCEHTGMIIEKGTWNMVQVPFNLIDQRHGEYFKAAKEKGIGVVVRSVLLKGLLSDRGVNLHPALKAVEAHIAKYQELIEGTDYNLSTLATKFAISFPEVSSVLIGIDRKEYLEQALRTVNGEYLAREKMGRAIQMSYPDPDFIDLPYWDKMNWLR